MPELHIELMGTNKSKRLDLYGIGRELMRIIVEYAKTNMFEKIQLKSINQSVEFYEKMGFTYDEIVSEQDIQENIYVIMYMIL